MGRPNVRTTKRLLDSFPSGPDSELWSQGYKKEGTQLCFFLFINFYLYGDCQRRLHNCWWSEVSLKARTLNRWSQVESFRCDSNKWDQDFWNSRSCTDFLRVWDLHILEWEVRWKRCLRKVWISKFERSSWALMLNWWSWKVDDSEGGVSRLVAVYVFTGVGHHIFIQTFGSFPRGVTLFNVNEWLKRHLRHTSG